MSLNRNSNGDEQITARLRPYMAGTARFLTAARLEDQIYAGEHPYAYAANNPVTYVDPEGLQPRQTVPPNDPAWSPKPVRPPWHGISGFGSGFSYGSYCGSSNRQNPGKGILPQDCVDACCQIHDRCLEAHYGAGFDPAGAHQCCDDALIHCASWALKSDCCKKFYPHDWYKYEECKAAARQIRPGIWIGKEVSIIGGGILFGPKPNCLPARQIPGFVKKNWGNPTCPQPTGTGSQNDGS